MDFDETDPAICPVLILDVDNGIDFTFKGLGLKGNRDSKQNSMVMWSVVLLSKSIGGKWGANPSRMATIPPPPSLSLF